jgi:uncharacterized cupin superfamily protein
MRGAPSPIHASVFVIGQTLQARLACALVYRRLSRSVETAAPDQLAVGYGRRVPVDFEQPSWETPKYPGRHVAPVGAQAGAQEIAANVYELDPGAVGSPLHFHHANEELLLVLAGTLSLRGPDGTQVLPAGAVVAFGRGQAGAHSLVNRSEAPVRYLVVSTTNRPDVVEYPDTAATLVVLADKRLAYPHGADADQQPVIAEAMRAAADHDA